MARKTKDRTKGGEIHKLISGGQALCKRTALYGLTFANPTRNIDVTCRHCLRLMVRETKKCT